MERWCPSYQVASDLVVGAHYLGNRGTRLASGDFQRNQPDPAAMQQLLLSGKEWNWVSDAASATDAGVPFPYPGFAGAGGRITPYPQVATGWGPLFFVGSPLGHSSYHALQLTADKRMSSGVAASLNYTFSRQRGDVDSGFQERWWSGPIQDVTRLSAEATVIGSQDRTHVFKGYATSDPADRAWTPPPWRRRWCDRRAGWWLDDQLAVPVRVGTAARRHFEQQLRGVVLPNLRQPQHGRPVARAVRRRRVQSLRSREPNQPVFQSSGLLDPVYGSLGTGPGRFEALRGFGAAYEDLGILKDVRAGRTVVQVRIDVLNLFNRRYLANPITDIASPLFGQVTTTAGELPRQVQIGVRWQW